MENNELTRNKRDSKLCPTCKGKGKVPIEKKSLTTLIKEIDSGYKNKSVMLNNLFPSGLR